MTSTFPPHLNRPVDFCCDRHGCGHHIDGHGLGENCYVRGCPCTAWRDHVNCGHRDGAEADPNAAIARVRALCKSAQAPTVGGDLTDVDTLAPSQVLAALDGRA